MANISRAAFGKALKSALPSGTPQYKVEKLAREKLGINLRHAGSVPKYKAIAAFKKAKGMGELKSAMHGTSTEGFGRLLDKAAAPKGPDAKVVKARNLANIRAEMEKAAEQKAKVTEALSRGKGAAPAKGSTSASRAQTPIAGGGVIGQAAREQSGSSRGGSQGMYGGEQQIERAAPAAAKDDDKPSADDAVDMFGED